MSKIKLTTLLVAGLITTHAYAGDMGHMTVNTSSKSIFFAGFEGDYTWADSSIGTDLNNTIPRVDERGWGGRVSVGVYNNYFEAFGISGEAGWGYYGKRLFQDSALNSAGSYTLYGFDLLFGLWKTYSNLDFFIKAGAMLETRRTTHTVNFSRLLPGGFASGTSVESSPMSTVVPEVKVGGIYNITEQLGASVSYMYLAGWNTRGSVQQSFSRTGGFVRNASLAGGPPSFSSIMFGLQYNFA